ncbi:hypothetical protein OXX80_006198 [Metschnikowia pulcherrima]
MGNLNKTSQANYCKDMRPFTLFIPLGFFLKISAGSNLDQQYVVQHSQLDTIHSERNGELFETSTEHDITLSKRYSDTEKINSIIDSLKTRLTELNLSKLIRHEYFDELSREGTEKEFQEEIGIVRKVFWGQASNELSMAYKGKARPQDRPSSKRNSGEDFAWLRAFHNGHSLLGVISGISDWLPSGEDSGALCDAMLKTTQNKYGRMADGTSFDAERLLIASWNELKRAKIHPGCISSLLMTISPENKISVANMGKAWAGLFRNGQLIQTTHRSMHEDGSSHQLCIPHPEIDPACIDDIQSGTNTYFWDAEVGDIIMAVSGGVREVLAPERLFAAMNTIESMGISVPPNGDPFALMAMSIVKAAQIASNGPQKNDMSAIVFGVN